MCLTTTCVYAILASGGGYYQHVYYPHVPVPSGQHRSGSNNVVDNFTSSPRDFILRQNFYVRFVDWGVGLPLTILILALIARLKLRIIILNLAFAAILISAVSSPLSLVDFVGVALIHSCPSDRPYFFPPEIHPTNFASTNMDCTRPFARSAPLHPLYLIKSIFKYFQSPRRRNVYLSVRIAIHTVGLLCIHFLPGSKDSCHCRR